MLGSCAWQESAKEAPPRELRLQVIDEVRNKVCECDVSVVILDFSHVPAIDAVGLVSMRSDAVLVRLSRCC